MNYYECHITMEADAYKIRPLVEKLGWKFSSIYGDIVFGETVKCYATHHFHGGKPAEEVLNTLNLVADILAGKGAKVIRRKIELVIHDDRSSKVRLEDTNDQATVQDDYSQNITGKSAEQPTMDAATVPSCGGAPNESQGDCSSDSSE